MNVIYNPVDTKWYVGNTNIRDVYEVSESLAKEIIALKNEVERKEYL